MSNAWETTNDDVKIVLDRHNVKVSEERLNEIGDMLNMDEIESAALYGDDMDEQTERAYEEIEKQLKEAKVI